MDINKQKELENLGRRIRQLREQKDWSQREMASRCNIDSASIGKMERGELDIRYTTLLQLALVLEVTPAELLNS
ncbi:Helix-turn-helix domain-containing protein [Chitinophaga ginsengisegetis]|uniref:Helix-turn-helix domain-containing protein n=1 Tax=Chitinophaga ginsengisegetis TaxID=393003 RepID=A0A1T5PCX5_9BACT|nr:helix-turn-helix transcriptional regulator [Chitinophaga ginsengisegetis]MDR6570156.1 transcriptional regulator with XRE-family HTH domain [Chitinophaga ginsengisegetis]MDR6649890.1 transcriptional regulator with XRE-family HTH domain [Chitinophaga ginsengisegetis]MDR6656469.1 transcriptional regulator with XRE-family HTH domain [Chitinophaga ginsengisegetis]SKD10467.1 Helix-turn-helix domain-containing protein [Chitinophaga ginsengisegetis]